MLSVLSCSYQSSLYPDHVHWKIGYCIWKSLLLSNSTEDWLIQNTHLTIYSAYSDLSKVRKQVYSETPGRTQDTQQGDIVWWIPAILRMLRKVAKGYKVYYNF